MTGIMQVLLGAGRTGSLALSGATVTGVAYFDGVSSFAPGTARIRLGNTGQLRLENTDGTAVSSFNIVTPLNQWGSPVPVSGVNFEAQLTVSSGTTPTGAATATWLTLDTERVWNLVGLSNTNVGQQTGSYSLTIRNRFNTTQTVTASFILNAQNRSTP